ncbi:MAG: hypothetical protein B6241_11260 [Spirochaetaceae bacterium 4572_59]|nr:MAG: hypothetical protein B6241_11260 [Spirochaetaceae bacterium 4572_59]
MDKNPSPNFDEIITPILNNHHFARLSQINHHGNSILDHSMKVCRLAWRIAGKLNLDQRTVARGALLHDFFLYDWKEGSNSRRRFYELHKMHGFTHAREALKNAEANFTLNPKEKDIILKHMFPLNIRPPRYAESWVVTLSDKIVALSELGLYFRYNLKFFSRDKE